MSGPPNPKESREVDTHVLRGKQFLQIFRNCEAFLKSNSVSDPAIAGNLDGIEFDMLGFEKVLQPYQVKRVGRRLDYDVTLGKRDGLFLTLDRKDNQQ